MTENIKDKEMDEFHKEFIALMEKHNVTGAMCILETDDDCQLLIHNFSYEDIKNHLCYANYCNERDFIEECEKIDAIEYMEKNN